MNRDALAVIAALACLAPASSRADDIVHYGPPPAWIRPVAIPAANAGSEGPIEALLLDMESQLGRDGVETYVESAFRVRNETGLAAAGTVVALWDPAADTLTVHSLQIVRGTQVIDVQASGDGFMVLRQETDLSRATLNGRLTANRQIEGLQIGDTVRFAYSIRHRDPTMPDHAEQVAPVLFPIPVTLFRQRVIWPSLHPVQFRAQPELGRVTPTRTSNGSEVVLERRNLSVRTPVPDAPMRYNLPPALEFTDFAGWRDISARFEPLFRTAATLGPDSPLRAEAERIRAASQDPVARASAALSLVEQRVRYFNVATGNGGYTPAQADQTWGRRYGDCKGKTALLLALLTELGIQAEPALVSTVFHDGLDQRLPLVSWFDHAVLRVTIDGHVYWLDATRQGDASLAELTPPNFGWALPVRAGGADLEAIPQSPATHPTHERRVLIDASGGLDGSVDLHLEDRYYGELGRAIQVEASAHSREELEQNYRNELGDNAANLRSVRFDSHADDGAYALVTDLHQEQHWIDRGGDIREFRLPDSSFSQSFTPRPGGARELPYQLAFPHFDRSSYRVRLPHNGEGFEVVGDDVHETVGPFEISRTSRISGGEAIMQLDIRTLRPEVSAADARTAQARLEAIATASAVYIRARGYRMSLAEATERVTRAPDQAEPLFVRSRVHYDAHRYAEAAADLTAAIRLDPQNNRMLVARAQAYSHQGNHAAALADADEVIRRDPQDVNFRLARSEIRDSASLTSQSIEDLDEAIRLSPASAALFNSRCWRKATRNVDLAGAEQDCETALRIEPRSSATLDSRAFLNLRLGRLSRALADYNAALDINPRQAVSIYGRGLTRIRQGEVAAGRADLAAATAIDSTVAATFERYGMAPGDLAAAPSSGTSGQNPPQASPSPPAPPPSAGTSPPPPPP